MRILHLFNWNLTDINPAKVRAQGFDAIQINPIQPLKSDDDEWWLSYQPIDYRIGNKYGTKEELRILCEEANKYNLLIIADIVINHVAGSDTGEIVPHEKVHRALSFNTEYFKSFEPINNWNDRKEVITKSMGLPGLKLSNETLQNIIFSFMEELISIGIGGFRIDAAKNIELPSEGSSFWENFKNRFEYRGLFNYAEIIFSDQKLLSEYSKYVRVLTEGYIKNEERLVTFVESHDTYLEFLSTRRMNSDMILSEYEVISKRFKHSLFYSRPYDKLWESELVKNINLKNK